MKERRHQHTVFEYIFSAVINAVLLWVMHRLPAWKPFFLLPSYSQVLWAIDLSLIVQIVMNLALVFFHPLFFHYLANAVFSLVSIVSISTILKVFPVDFSTRLGFWANTAFRIVLIVALAASAIGMIVHLVRFLRALRRPEPEA